MKLSDKIDIMAQKTIELFGYDPNELSPNDSKLVYMQCLTCYEEFIRPISLKYAGHACEGVQRWKVRSAFTMPRIECKLISPLAKLPYRARVTDAGHDVYSIENVIVPRKSMMKVHTGLIVAVPEGFYYTVNGRSGMWSDHTIVPNRGIIDAGYTDELIVSLLNLSDTDYGVSMGDRIAQIIVHRVEDFDIAIVDKFSHGYNMRGNNGFGSSGK